MTNAISRLSVKEKVGYSLGDMASNLFFQTAVLFLMYFYTDVFGITAGAVGTMFLLTRVWDAVNDPIMGMLADRTETRWGKFRPYLLWFAVPFGIFIVLTFTTPDWSPGFKLVYAYATYTLMMMVYTAINVPYSALMGVITPNALERTEVSSFRFVAAFIGQFIIQGTVMTLVRKIGGDNEALGWQGAMTVIAVLAIALWIISFATSKERVHPRKEQTTSWSQDLSDLFHNMPWLLIGISSVLQLISFVGRGTTIMYYFKYFVQDQHINFLGKIYELPYEGTVSAFFLVGSSFTILGAILTKWITKKLDKRNTYTGMMLIATIGTLIFFFLKPEQIVLMFIFQIILSFAMGPVSVLQWSIFTDTADYAEWKFNRRATGLVMSASLFTIKLGLALGGAIVGWALEIFNFVPNVEQTGEAILGIQLSIAIFPAIAGAVCVLIMWFYPLSNAKMVEIEKELEARRA